LFELIIVAWVSIGALMLLIFVGKPDSIGSWLAFFALAPLAPVVVAVVGTLKGIDQILEAIDAALNK